MFFAISQYAGENNKLMTDDLGLEWFEYVGSNIETTREFCEHLTEKRYIHKSEIKTILKGKIDGHQCEIYEKTGLPKGMIEGTNEQNFQVNCGGWNCRHQLVPVAKEAVPKNKVTPKSDKEWFKKVRSDVKDKFDKNTPLKIDNKKVAFTRLYYSKDDYKCVLSHCFDIEELEAAAQLQSMLGKIKNGRVESLDSSRKNINKKVENGIKFFVAYDLTINGKEYILKTKAQSKKGDKHGQLIEYPYCLKKRES